MTGSPPSTSLAAERPWLAVEPDPPGPPGSYPALVTADDY